MKNRRSYIKTSRQEASYGQRYPCPALYSFWVEVGLQRGSGPDRGRSPVEWGDFPFVRPSVRPSLHPSVRPSIHPSVPPLEGPRASQAGLRARQAGLRASQPGLSALLPSLRASQPASIRRTHKRKDRKKISPFYRTSFPIGAAAQNVYYRFLKNLNRCPIKPPKSFFSQQDLF